MQYLPYITVIVVHDWYDNSLIEDDPPIHDGHLMNLRLRRYLPMSRLELGQSAYQVYAGHWTRLRNGSKKVRVQALCGAPRGQTSAWILANCISLHPITESVLQTPRKVGLQDRQHATESVTRLGEHAG